MSTTHFNPDPLCLTRRIKSAKMCSCCRKAKQPQLTIWETGPPGPGVAQLRTLLHAKPPHTHTQTHTASGGRQQSPCHLRLRAAHVGPATPHTQLSGPRPPWCPTAAMEGLPESYFSSAEQTQKSACLKSMQSCRKNMSKYISQCDGFQFGLAAHRSI